MFGQLSIPGVDPGRGGGVGGQQGSRSALEVYKMRYSNREVS